MRSGPAGSGRNRIPSFSASGFASRSAWLGVIEAGGAGRRALADRTAVEQQHLAAGQRQLQRRRGADRAGADDGDLGRPGNSTAASYGRRAPCPTLPAVEIVLALGAALAWGFADFASGVKSRTNSTIVVTAIVLGAGGIVSLVIAARTEERRPAAPSRWPWRPAPRPASA